MGDNKISDEVIRDLFLRNGFTIKEGQDDLKPYVYAAARDLIAHLQGEAVPVFFVEDDFGLWNMTTESNYSFWEKSGSKKVMKLYPHPQPAELSEVSGGSGELVADIYKVASTPGMTPIDLADWIRDVLMRNIYALAATGKQQVGEVQGNSRSPSEMADALERIAGGALSDYEGVETDELHILRCAKLIRDLASRQPVYAVPPGMVMVQIADAERLCSIGESFGQHFDTLPVKRVRALLDGRDAGTGVE